MAGSEIDGRHVVVEEKLDGSNTGLSFDGKGGLRLQSRGHVLAGGPRERQYALLKAWSEVHRGWLRETLGTRYVLYGEWLYALHSVFYDALPHYFFEFDILDLERGLFLSTPARRRMLEGGPVRSVPVLYEGPFPGIGALPGFIGPSLYRTPRWREARREAAMQAGMDPDVLAAQTDDSDDAEGLYIKIEEGDETTGRAKWVRRSFTARILESGTHWHDRPLIPNRLLPGTDLFGQA